MNEHERRETLSRLELVMGECPDEDRRARLDVEIIEEATEGDIVRRRITFTTEPGDRCHGWLMLPSPACGLPRPAMLCLHQTTAIGKDEPSFGIGVDDPQRPLDVDGIVRSQTGGFEFPDGSVQTTAGTVRLSKATGSPAIASAAIFPWRLALWASIGPGVTSPIA